MSYETDLKENYAAVRQRILSAGLKPKVIAPVVEDDPPPPQPPPVVEDTPAAEPILIADVQDALIVPTIAASIVPTIIDVQLAVCRHYGDITRREMISPMRSKYFVRPRHVAVFLCSMLCQKSLPQMGRQFGGRDHTTILHARETMRVKLRTDNELRTDVDAILDDLRRRRFIPDDVTSLGGEG